MAVGGGQRSIDFDYLRDKRLWCHAKNIDALDIMTSYSDIHSFWHQNDDFTLTSRNFIWTYPGKQLTQNSICVLPEFGEDKSKIILPKNI